MAAGLQCADVAFTGLVDAMRVSDDVERNPHRFSQIARESFTAVGNTNGFGISTRTALRWSIFRIRKPIKPVTTTTVMLLRQ